MVVEDDTLVGMGLISHLGKLGHEVIGQASNIQEALSMFESHRIDLVLLDIRLERDDGLALAAQLQAIRPVPIIVISAYSEEELIRRAADAGVFGYLVKPVSYEQLAAQVSVALQRFAEQTVLLAKNKELQQNLETRKLAEKAKGILMRRLNLSEDDAHRRLQKESQSRRISLAEIAKKVIESEELLGA